MVYFLEAKLPSASNRTVSNSLEAETPRINRSFPSLLSIFLSLNEIMNLKTLNRHDLIAIENPSFKKLKSHSTCLSESRVCFSSRHRHRKYQGLSGIRILLDNRCNRLITACISPSQEIVGEESGVAAENAEIEELEEATEVVESKREEFVGNDSLWNQVVEIVKFSGPAVGLWICGPLMSLIDTVVIGQGSAIELAALGNTLL